MYAAGQEQRNKRAPDAASYPGHRARLSHGQNPECYFRKSTRLCKLYNGFTCLFFFFFLILGVYFSQTDDMCKTSNAPMRLLNIE